MLIVIIIFIRIYSSSAQMIEDEAEIVNVNTITAKQMDYYIKRKSLSKLSIFIKYL